MVPSRLAPFVAPDVDDQGVVEVSHVVDRVDEATDVPVGVLLVAGIDLRLPDVQLLRVVVERVPRLGNASGRAVSSASAGMMPSCFWRWNVRSRSLSQPSSNCPPGLVGPLGGDVVRGVRTAGRDNMNQGSVVIPARGPGGATRSTCRRGNLAW